VKCNFFTVLFLFISVLFSNYSSSESCPDAELFGEKLLESFCWDCIFPIRLNGQTIKGGGGSGDIPDGAMNSLICSCPDPFGIPEFGVPMAAWFPRFLTETVQKPYCSPTLLGTNLTGETRLAVGGDVSSRKRKSERAVSDSAFLHFHTLSFPILEMLELLANSQCNPDQFVDMELQYLSEPDPLWSDNLLAAILTPEAALFTNPAAMAACAVECNALTSNPDDVDFHWCAGCWGGTYPFTGHANHNGSRIKHSSLVATKALSALHRRLLAFDTVGSSEACDARIAPSLIKSQYRFGMMYPSPEASSNHYLGASTVLWGENRSRAAAGSNHVYAGFRYQDCCLR
jgi:conjugal transfer pilus assembly protein TraU